MLDRSLGETAARVLLFVHAVDGAYAREIPTNFYLSRSAVQNQLKNLEHAVVLGSQTWGTVRLYRLNPRSPFQRELRQRLNRVLELIPKGERKKYCGRRTRPRRAGTPL